MVALQVIKGLGKVGRVRGIHQQPPVFEEGAHQVCIHINLVLGKYAFVQQVGKRQQQYRFMRRSTIFGNAAFKSGKFIQKLLE